MKDADKYEVGDIVSGWSTKGWRENGRYLPAGSWSRLSDPESHYLVLEQRLDELGDDVHWSLHQDLELALGLRRQGDTWLRPAEDDLEVVRLRRQRDQRGEHRSIEIRLEHLGDYLAFRSSHLLLGQYRERLTYEQNPVDTGWQSGVIEALPDGRWEGTACRQGSGFAVMHVYRTDGDPSQDIPIEGGPDDGNVVVKVAKTPPPNPSALWCNRGALWKREWVEPARRSTRAGDDEDETRLEFLTAPDGSNTPNRDTLVWLHFDARVANELLSRPRVSLMWLTRETGRLGTRAASVHFGLNGLGRLNVLEPDIRSLPLHHQRVWHAHNLTPEGGVSSELFAAQVRATPASTTAPESSFERAFRRFRACSAARFGQPAIPYTADEPDLLRIVHRFRGRDLPGFFGLAKDMARLVVDGLGKSTDLLRSQSGRPMNEIKELGSIKLLELVLDRFTNDPRSLLSPIVGIYELRHQDAHRPSSDWGASLALTGTAASDDTVGMAAGVIGSVASSLAAIADALQ